MTNLSNTKWYTSHLNGMFKTSPLLGFMRAVCSTLHEEEAFVRIPLRHSCRRSLQNLFRA